VRYFWWSDVHLVWMVRFDSWDPMRPDGRYTLDLAVWEDRVVAHVLTQLAVAEPGENWVGTFWRYTSIQLLFRLCLADDQSGCLS
jgi:hypothetical protein